MVSLCQDNSHHPLYQMVDIHCWILLQILPRRLILSRLHPPASYTHDYDETMLLIHCVAVLYTTTIIIYFDTYTALIIELFIINKCNVGTFLCVVQLGKYNYHPSVIQLGAIPSFKRSQSKI